jgi:glycosyltransferase involved in cell wall biosynthesis
MQNKHEAILSAINNESGQYNILTFPTHEAYQSNWESLPHRFYLYQGENIKPWSNKYRQLPTNHVLLNGSKGQILPDMKFDIVLSQNKFGQFQVAKQIAEAINAPLISLEHTLPVPEWNTKHLQMMKGMSGDINVFISEYSVSKWQFDINDPSTRIVHHGIDIRKFKPGQGGSGRILTVVNDWINRDWCCGWSIYRRVADGLPLEPVGDTPGFSKPAKDVDELVAKYQGASAFLNTSTVSPVPTALLEAMACGCPVVTTSNCMIPEVVQDGLNGFCSNDESYLREKAIWCLANPEEARATVGQKARQTILDKFSLDKHLEKWNNIFNEVYGKAIVR